MADETATGVNGPLTVRYLTVPGSARTGRHFAEVTIPAAELTWRFSRSAGPGGQGVNTTDSRAELSFDLAATEAVPPFLKARALERLDGRLTAAGVLTVTASEQRSQLQNREAARDRLAFTLAEALAPPPPPRREKKTPAGVTRRRLEGKARRAQVKQMRRRVDDY